MVLSAARDLRGIGAIFRGTRALAGLVLELGLCRTGVAILYYLIVTRLGVRGVGPHLHPAGWPR